MKREGGEGRSNNKFRDLSLKKHQVRSYRLGVLLPVLGSKVRSLTAGAFKQHFVVESQSQLGHSCKSDLHLDGAHNLTLKNMAVLAHL